MDLWDYQHEAMKTCGQTSVKDMLVNVGLSLPEEAGEVVETFNSIQPGVDMLDVVTSVKKELGDIVWYSAELCHAVDWNLINLNYTNVDYNRTLQQTLNLLVINTGKIAGIVKKHIFHGHLLDLESIQVYLTQVMICVNSLCEYGGFTLEDVLEANIAKLRKRYGEKFSADASINRVE